MVSSTYLINDKVYEASELSVLAIANFNLLRSTDEKIKLINQKIAVYQTARNAYSKELLSHLPKKRKSRKKLES